MNSNMNTNTDSKTGSMTSSRVKSISCTHCREQLSDLLLEPAVPAPSVQAHLAACAGCTAELAELRATFALLDEWTAPEPSTYFDTRLHAQLRAAAAAQPESWWERTRSFLLFSTGRSLRPAVAGAFGVLVLLGGLTFGGVYQHNAMTVASAPSATVNDLKILDKNAEALQQMDQLLDDGSNTDQTAPPTS